MSTPNPRNLSPVPTGPEREGQTYDVAVAQNTRRKGQSYAQEGLGYQQRYHGSFYEAVRDADSGASHTDVEVQPAGQAYNRSLLGSGQAVPSWAAVDQAERSAFNSGQSASEQVANPAGFPHFPRRGANPASLGPTYGFSGAAEVPGNIYVKQIGTGTGDRLADRRNEADVR